MKITFSSSLLATLMLVISIIRAEGSPRIRKVYDSAVPTGTYMYSYSVDDEVPGKYVTFNQTIVFDSHGTCVISKSNGVRTRARYSIRGKNRSIVSIVSNDDSIGLTTGQFLGNAIVFQADTFWGASFRHDSLVRFTRVEPKIREGHAQRKLRRMRRR